MVVGRMRAADVAVRLGRRRGRGPASHCPGPAVHLRLDLAEPGVERHGPLRRGARRGRERRAPRSVVSHALGEIGPALDEYEGSVEERDTYLVYPLFPGFAPLRSEPRFQQGLASLGLQWAIGR